MDEGYRDLSDQDAVAVAMDEYHGKRILDVGAGDTVGLSEAAPEDNEVVHMDRYPDQVQMGREKQGADTYEERAPAEHAAANAKEMPFQDDAYDVVFMGHSLNPPSLSYIENDSGQPNYWEGELGRVLKEGGDLVVQQTLLEDLSTEELLTVSGLAYRKEAFDEVEREGSVLKLKGYHPDQDPGEPGPAEKREIARDSADVMAEHHDYEDDPARDPREVVADAIADGAFESEDEDYVEDDDG